MLQGETILSGSPRTCECGAQFELEVLSSGAGYYIGTRCLNSECEEAYVPNSRESEYFHTQNDAAMALAAETWNPRGFFENYEGLLRVHGLTPIPVKAYK